MKTILAILLAAATAQAATILVNTNTSQVTGWTPADNQAPGPGEIAVVTNAIPANINTSWTYSNGVFTPVNADPEPAAVSPIYTRDLGTGKLVGLVVSNNVVTVYPAQNSPYTITADNANRGYYTGKLPRVFDKATNFFLGLNPPWSNVVTRTDLTNENLLVQWQVFCNAQINTNQTQAAAATNQTQAVTFINRSIDWLQRYSRGVQFLDRLQP